MNSIPLSSNVQPTNSARGNIIQQYPLVSAVAITFLLAFPIMFLDALSSYKLVPFEVPDLLGLFVGWTPAIGAVVVTGFIEGRVGIVNLLKRFFIARVGIQWYLVALFGIAATMLGGVALYQYLGGTVVMPIVGAPPQDVVFALVLTIGLGFVFNTEEVLWRGFMLPRLQKRHTALVAALLVAIPESILHLPYFFNQEAEFFQNVGMVVFTVFTIALAVLYAWLFNNTRGSLLLVTLTHASQNAWSNLLTDTQAAPFYYTLGLLVIAAVVVVIVFGVKRLSRNPAIPGQGLP